MHAHFSFLHNSLEIWSAQLLRQAGNQRSLRRYSEKFSLLCVAPNFCTHRKDCNLSGFIGRLSKHEFQSIILFTEAYRFPMAIGLFIYTLAVCTATKYVYK